MLKLLHKKSINSTMLFCCACYARISLHSPAYFVCYEIELQMIQYLQINLPVIGRRIAAARSVFLQPFCMQNYLSAKLEVCLYVIDTSNGFVVHIRRKH